MILLRQLRSSSLLPKRIISLNQSRSFFGGSQPQEYTIRKKINQPSDIFFKVVSGVDQYHKFVPYCTESFVTRYDQSDLPAEGGLKVGFKEFNEKFVCRIKCENNQDEPKLVEAESLSDNLFDHLKMKWYIEEDPKRPSATKMILHLNYKFSNPLYNTVSALFAENITKIMIKAFTKRAIEIKTEQQKQKQ
ncbi:ubiquinone-binding protein [Saccharomycopsis crataegensis]|uniref:Ubiquinone-binding protein n=1 Tax=Saccharomycopsis crataegensis TaxID=43959 RepID=A0AAV5QMK0_9ASCO|nr:ubiquinone-binding protein [Saccharomycopsis crataegensis]